MKRVAVLTSGGDAPGMNAAVRAAVRTGAALGLEMLGVRRGYAGLIAGDFVPLGPRAVGGIIERGGTVLGTSRCTEFLADAGQREAIAQLQRHEISGLVVIGGNGSQRGACALGRQGVRVVGIASTIDNDLAGSDVTIGATTALGIALEAIDRLRVTASAHGRMFLVEVMGRHSGYLALHAGIAGGAEAILIPEIETEPESLAAAVLAAYRRGKSHAIVVVAEGARHDADALARHFEAHRERLGFELRVSKLGHIQRGGVPCAFDRLSATVLGAAAVQELYAGRDGVLAGIVAGKTTFTPLAAATAARKNPDLQLMELARALAE